MDKQDLAFLFNKYGPGVYRRCLYLLRNQADAEEATQEVFLKALKNIQTFEQRSGIYTWLIKIATNHCLNHIRNSQRQSELLEEQGSSVAPEKPSSSVEETAIISQLLAQTDPLCAEAAVFVLVDGLTHREAAKLLGVSARTVGYWVERFIASCREQAQDEI